VYQFLIQKILQYYIIVHYGERVSHDREQIPVARKIHLLAEQQNSNTELHRTAGSRTGRYRLEPPAWSDCRRGSRPIRFCSWKAGSFRLNTHRRQRSRTERFCKAL